MKKKLSTVKTKVSKKTKETSLKKAPGAPKRFRSSYILFFLQIQDSIVKSLTAEDLIPSAPAVSKRASKMWKALSVEERKPWETKAKEEKERYNNAKKAYKGPWKVPHTRAKRDASAPKRNPSAFLLYCMKNRKSLGREHPKLSNIELSRILGSRWRTIAAHEKEPYIKHEAAERILYMQRVAKWKEESQKQKNELSNKEEGLSPSTKPACDAVSDSSPHEGQQMVKKSTEKNQLAAGKESSGSLSSIRCSDVTTRTSSTMETREHGDGKISWDHQKEDPAGPPNGDLTSTTPCLLVSKEQHTSLVVATEESVVVNKEDKDTLMLDSIAEESLRFQEIASSLLPIDTEATGTYNENSTISVVHQYYSKRINKFETNLISPMNDFVEEESSHVHSFQEHFLCKEYGTNEDLKCSTNRDELIHPGHDCPQPNLNFLSIPLVSPQYRSPHHTQPRRVSYYQNVHNDIAIHQSSAHTSWNQNHANIMPRGHMPTEIIYDNSNPNTKNGVGKVSPALVTPARNGEEAMLSPFLFSDELTVELDYLDDLDTEDSDLGNDNSIEPIAFNFDI